MVIKEEIKNLNIGQDDLNCDTCPDVYKLPCIEYGGEPREDGDDHTAFIGSHLCRASWHQFNIDCINKGCGCIKQ